jgi:SIR2-like domain
LPTAGTITVKETLDLLDGAFQGLSDGVAKGSYAFWLGSRISRERVVGLDGVLEKLIDFLRTHATGDPDYGRALDKILGMATLSDGERKGIDFAQPVANWPCRKALLGRLWNQYSKVLSVEIPTQRLDYLLWVGLDFKNTFANQNPDAEHLAIGMLALEGAVTEIATANWDGLLEGAMVALGHADTFYRITVTGDDLRGPAAAARLYKFHGCALRAIEHEEDYRPLLVARSAQITSWMTNDTFKITRDQLEALIQRARTLVIGMSAQDENIKNLFGKVNVHKGWKWADQPPPIVFSANELGADQKDLLNVAYGADYEVNREAIWESACLPAYAKPLLLALLLNVLTAKAKILASDVTAPGLDDDGHARIAHGLTHLRDRAAHAAEGDRLLFTKGLAGGLARARHQLQNGSSPPGFAAYFPLDEQPAHLMKCKLGLVSTGQREVAAAMGLIGLECEATAWTPVVDDPAEIRSGALRVSSTTAEARIFFAANDENITSLMECGAFDEDDSDVVVICSRRVTERQQRNPRSRLRSGKIAPRLVAFGPMLAGAATLDGLREAFRDEVGL